MDELKIQEFEEAFSDPIEKKVAHMIATSHEYKKPNIKAGLSFTKNYKWELATEKVSNLQGINKPIIDEKVKELAEKIKENKVNPLVVVNQLHGIRPQTHGKKVLMDGHHRLEACKLLKIDEVPVYKGTYTGKAELSTKELKKQASRDEIGNKDFKLISTSKEVIDNFKQQYPNLRHVRVGDNLTGVALLDKDKFVGLVQVDKEKEGIVALDVQPDYREKQLGSLLLNYAESKLGANKLSVNKHNEVAINMYKNRGYKQYDETDHMLFLKKQAQLNEDVKLYPHQDRAVKRMLKHPNTILAHSVGSGKTLTSIAGFEKLKDQGHAKRALVVVPASLRENYATEGVKKFTKSKFNIVGNQQELASKLPNYGLPTSEADYNIVSYELFRSNPHKYLQETEADTVIFDELHRSKNITKTYESIKKTRHLYKNFIGGTGSIVSNKITDVIPLIDAATAGSKNMTSKENLKKFQDRYFVRDNSPKYKHLHVERKPIKALAHKDELKHFLNEYVDYVDYDDVKGIAKMPEKRVREVRVPLSGEQAKAYKRLLREDRGLNELIQKRRYEYLRDDELSRFYNKLTEARKLVNDVGTIKPGVPIAETVEQSPKAKALLDDAAAHLRETPDGRVVLTSFLIRGGTDALEAGLKNRNVPYGRFLGKGNDGVTEESRQEDVKKFNKGKLRALILSAAGGEGLSLNDTTKIETLDPHFNPERMKQMEARGIRSGGLSKRPPEQRVVDVNRYISTMPDHKLWFARWKDNTPTPDEIIYNLAQKKEKQNALIHNLLKDMMKEKKD